MITSNPTRAVMIRGARIAAALFAGASLAACGIGSDAGNTNPESAWPSGSSGCGVLMEDEQFASESLLRDVLAASNSFGLRSPGSDADAGHIDWIVEQLERMPGVEVRTDEYELHRWEPTPVAQNGQGRSLALAGTLEVSAPGSDAVSLPIAGAVPFSFPTGDAPTTGELVYIPEDVAITPANARGKVVIRDYPSAPVPYAAFLALAYYIAPDGLETSGELDRPYLGSGKQDQDMIDAGLAEAAGVIFTFNVPREEVAGYWDPHSGMHFLVPALHVGVDEGERLKELALEAATASVGVLAKRDLNTTRSIIATLPGQSPERVVLSSNHDGMTWVQENGVAGLLAFADYFSRRPIECRQRTLEFVFGASHLALASEGTDRYAEQLDEEYEDGTVAFAFALEHMGTREILPVPREDGPGEQLEFTGQGELSGWFVGESPALINAVTSAVIRRDLSRVSVLRGADLPGVGRFPLHCSFGGLGNLFHRRLIPTTAFISGPWSLWAPSFGESAIDFARLRNQLLAAGDVILETEAQTREAIAGSYALQRELVQNGFPTCPPEIRPVEAPRPSS